MAVEYRVVCTKCGRERDDPSAWRCSCGGHYRVELEGEFDPSRIDAGEFSVWRYAAYFPYVDPGRRVSMGEGWTPIVMGGGDGPWFKLEYLMPTGSYKDRGSSVLVSGILSDLGGSVRGISEDSSGNAGASIAAYCARAGIGARTYVPAGASEAKVEQIRAYGAEVVEVEGRLEAARAAAQGPRDKVGDGYVYAGHIWHPYFRDGIRTLAYEIWERSGWAGFDRIYVPTSAGTLLLGLADGLEHLDASGLVRRFPSIVAAQPAAVSPIYSAFRGIPYSPQREVRTIADALVSSDSPLIGDVVDELRRRGGDAVAVEEEEIAAAHRALARMGFYVEPSSAVAYAAYLRQMEGGEADGRSLVLLTGSGLKSGSRRQG